MAISTQLTQVADYFLAQAAKDERPVSNKKLQKLVYYAQAWHLVFNNGKKLFEDPVEAWIHGPAVRALYGKYKSYGYQPITENPDKPVFKSEKTESLLMEIWRIYGKYNAQYLEALSHSEPPWQEARADVGPFDSSSQIISTSRMKAYYEQKLEETEA